MLLFYYIPFSKLAIYGRSSLGLFGLSKAPSAGAPLGLSWGSLLGIPGPAWGSLAHPSIPAAGLLHPGSWAEASKSWFWSLALKPHVSLTFSLANWPIWAPGAPWGFWASKSWFWSLAPKPHVSLTFSLANRPFLAAEAPWGFWASKFWFRGLAPKPHVSLTFSLANWPR